MFFYNKESQEHASSFHEMYCILSKDEFRNVEDGLMDLLGRKLVFMRTWYIV